MIDVSSKMQIFRDAGIQIWNSYLMPGFHVVRLDIEESFDIIERELLRCLVLGGNSDAADNYREKPIDCLLVKLADGLNDVLIKVAKRDENGNTTWEESVLYSRDNSYQLQFYDFFDWNHFGIIEYGFVRVVDITTNRLMLLPAEACSFWLNNDDCTAHS
jgi:hypothetical protein